MHEVKLLSNDILLVCQPKVVEKFGHLGAVLLNQLHYWINNKNVGVNFQGQKWVYITAKELACQVGASVRTVWRYVAEFVKHKFLIINKLSRHKSNRTNYYTIDYRVLQLLFNTTQDSECLRDQEKICSPYTGYNLINSNSNASDHCAKMSQLMSQEVSMVKQRLQTKSYKISEESYKADNSSSEVLGEVVSAAQVMNLQVDKDKINNKLFLVDNGDTSKEKQVITADVPAKTNTAKEMLSIWHEEFPSCKVSMNLQLAKYLVACYKHKFNSRLEDWQEYCRKIKSSKYLMSEQFVLSIYWAIQYNTIDKIESGYYGIRQEYAGKDPQVLSIGKKESVLLQDEALQHISAKQEPLECKKLRKKLLEVIGADNYLSYFTETELFYENEQFVFKASNIFAQNTITQKWLELFKQCA